MVYYKLKCEYEWCKYETIYPQGLEIHLKSVHTRKKNKAPRRIKAFQDESKLLNCNQCGFKTMFNHQLKLHIKSVHDKIKDVICKICQFATTHKCVLVKHMRRKHSQILSTAEDNSVKGITPTIIKFDCKLILITANTAVIQNFKDLPRDGVVVAADTGSF